MKKNIIITVAACVLCFLVGLLAGRINMMAGSSPADATTATMESIEIRVYEGNVEWFNGVEWVVCGKVEDMIQSDEMSLEELKEYYYPIIVKQLEEESLQAESESIKESESASIAEEESKAIAESEAASKAAEEKAKKPAAVTNKPATVTKPAAPAVEDNDDDDDDDSYSEPEPAPEPEPEPEPEPDPVEDNSGDGEDMEWSDDIL